MIYTKQTEAKIKNINEYAKNVKLFKILASLHQSVDDVEALRSIKLEVSSNLTSANCPTVSIG